MKPRDFHGAEVDERAVLSIALMDPEQIEQMDLRPDDFFDSQLGELWGIILNRRALELPTEPTALIGDAKRIFGPKAAAVLGELVVEVPGTHHAKYYAGQVRKQSKLRELEVIASEINSMVAGGAKTPEEISASVEHRISQIGADKENYQSTAYEAGLELIERLELSLIHI